MLTTYEKNQLTQVLARAHGQTGARIAVVVADKSDRYLYLPLLWAGSAALVFPAAAMLLRPTLTFEALYPTQVGLFLAIALGLRWPPLLMPLVPHRHRQARVAAYARHWVAETKLGEAADVLIFASLAERLAEVRPSGALENKLPDQKWALLSAQLTDDLRHNNVANGLERVVSDCAAALALHMPPKGKSSPQSTPLFVGAPDI
jgi:uncharacterized membrane protein